MCLFFPPALSMYTFYHMSVAVNEFFLLTVNGELRLEKREHYVIQIYLFMYLLKKVFGEYFYILPALDFI